MRWIRLFLIIILSQLGLNAQPWVRNMVDQVSIKPQESPYLMPPEGSVPRSGKEPKRTWEEGNDIPNPVPWSPEAIKSGQKLYQRYCAVCHGKEATAGGGPIVKIAPSFTPPDLTMDIYINERKDGYFYEIIRQGHVIMPPYYEGTSQKDRWNIVHYIRELQKIRRFQP